MSVLALYPPEISHAISTVANHDDLVPTRPGFDPQELMDSVYLPATALAAGISTSLGTLLVEQTYRGKQFNRAVYICDDINFLFGYDHKDLNKNILLSSGHSLFDGACCLVECGRIMSEAILSSEVVRREVVGCFLFPGEYDPYGASEGVVKKYEDLQDGEYLTSQAIEALRQESQVQLPNEERPIFCAFATPLLKEIEALYGRRLVYSHRLIHNYQEVINQFTTTLICQPLPVDKSSWLGAIEDQIVALLGVQYLKLSSMELPNALPGIWTFDGIGYVTDAQTLLSKSLTVDQEANLFRTMEASNVDLTRRVRLMNLLMSYQI